MTRLLELADVVARRAGLAVAETPGWRDRGHGEMALPRCVVVHHTAGAAGGDAPSLATVIGGRPDLAGPLAHLLVARTGTVHVVAAGLCWHTGATREPWQANAYAVGIECEHTGDEADPWPPAQLDAMRRLCTALCGHYGIPHARVLAHREICEPPGRKIDPAGIDMRAFRAALAATEEDAMALSDTDIDRIAAAVWRYAIRNAFGDDVQAQQILNGTEQRTAEILDAANLLIERTSVRWEVAAPS